MHAWELAIENGARCFQTRDVGEEDEEDCARIWAELGPPGRAVSVLAVCHAMHSIVPPRCFLALGLL